MRNLILLSLILVAVGCVKNEKKTESTIEKTIEQDTFESVFIGNEVFDTSIRLIPYGGISYRLMVCPFIDNKINKYTTEVMLLDKNYSDTIFRETINAEVLIEKMNEYKERFMDTLNVDTLNDFKLVEVVSTGGIRNYMSYLIARLSKGDSNDIYLPIEIKAFQGEVGRLRVQLYHYHKEGFEQEKEELKKHQKYLDSIK